MDIINFLNIWAPVSYFLMIVMIIMIDVKGDHILGIIIAMTICWPLAYVFLRFFINFIDLGILKW